MSPNGPFSRCLAVLSQRLPWIVVATMLLLGVAIGLESARLFRRQDGHPRHFDVAASADHVASRLETQSIASTRSPSFLDVIQDDWSVEYHWSHDLPRGGGAMTMHLQSSGQLTQSQEVRLGAERIESARIVDEGSRLKGLSAAEDAIARFTFDSAKRGKPYDVPKVAISLRSGRSEIGVEFDNFYGVDADVDSAIRGFTNLTGLSGKTPLPVPRVDRFVPRPATDWQISMTIRDAVGRTVTWTVIEDRDLSVHGELSDEIVGWHSETMDNAAVQKLLEVSAGVICDFRFRPKFESGVDALDVSWSIGAGGMKIAIRESYGSPDALSASELGLLLKSITTGRDAAFDRRLPREVMGE